MLIFGRHRDEIEKLRAEVADLRREVRDYEREISRLKTELLVSKNTGTPEKFVNSGGTIYCDNVPLSCHNCSNHPSNGGSGICFCTLGGHPVIS
jgi:hypothetical protein